MNVLVIAPHPDDEAIGPGGTLWLHHERGDRVSVVFLTSGELGLKHLGREEAWAIREAEAQRAAGVLGIADVDFFRLPDWDVESHVEVGGARLAAAIERCAPGIIYCPHAEDEHPDHAASLPLLTAAIRRLPGRSPEVFAYEVWTPLSRFDHVEDISAALDRKLAAIDVYRSQLGEFRYDLAATGLAAYRGALAAKAPHAEVFQTVWLG